MGLVLLSTGRILFSIALSQSGYFMFEFGITLLLNIIFEFLSHRMLEEISNKEEIMKYIIIII